jgi:hypothetical protein
MAAAMTNTERCECAFSASRNRQKTMPSAIISSGASLRSKRMPYYLETSLPESFASGDVRLRAVNRFASAVGDAADLRPPLPDGDCLKQHHE